MQMFGAWSVLADVARVTGGRLRQLPLPIEPGRYQVGTSRLVFNGHTPDFSGVLVSDNGGRALPAIEWLGRPQMNAL
jgi:hypothetical protein